MITTRKVRRWRMLNFVAVGINIGALILSLLADSPLMIVQFVLIPILIWSIWIQTISIRRVAAREREAARPRPDYSAIARMEREVWGETFKHEGAPDASVADLNAMMDDLAERATAMRRRSRVPFEDDRRAMRALAAQRRGLCPDTTESATLEQYLKWLRGYIRSGGKPTHFYDYPFKNGRFRYARSGTLTIDSDYEYGARSRNIIVASGVKAERTRPGAVFDGWGHTKLYFMRGHRANDTIVPVYSDPEFAGIRLQFKDDAAAWRMR